MFNVTAIDTFFENHPLKERYFGFPEEDRSGACAVAERDAVAVLDYADILPEQENVFLAAVAEQTIYLLLNPLALTGFNDAVSQESSAGNSRSYREKKNPLCLRAASLLAPLAAAAADQQQGNSDADPDTPGNGTQEYPQEDVVPVATMKIMRG